MCTQSPFGFFTLSYTARCFASRCFVVVICLACLLLSLLLFLILISKHSLYIIQMAPCVYTIAVWIFYSFLHSSMLRLSLFRGRHMLGVLASLPFTFFNSYQQALFVYNSNSSLCIHNRFLNYIQSCASI